MAWPIIFVVIILPALWVEDRYFRSAFSSRVRTQRATLPQYGPLIDSEGVAELCGLSSYDQFVSKEHVVFWIDESHFETPGRGWPAEISVWAATTSLLSGYACSGRFTATAVIGTGREDPSFLFWLWQKDVQITDYLLVERLRPPPQREGYWSIVPGECVVVPIDPSVPDQLDRFLVELPANRRLNVELHHDFSVEELELLRWRIEQPTAYQEPIDRFPRGILASPDAHHAITMASGVHEFVVERHRYLPSPHRLQADTEPHAIPAYGLRVTWGDFVAVDRCPSEEAKRIVAGLSSRDDS